jgi:hypothetical protein
MRQRQDEEEPYILHSRHTVTLLWWRASRERESDSVTKMDRYRLCPLLPSLSQS